MARGKSKHGVNRVPAVDDDLAFPGSVKHDNTNVNTESHYRDFNPQRPGSKGVRVDGNLTPESKRGGIKFAPGYQDYL
jgi:hypothetical protein